MSVGIDHAAVEPFFTRAWETTWLAECAIARLAQHINVRSCTVGLLVDLDLLEKVSFAAGTALYRLRSPETFAEDLRAIDTMCRLGADLPANTT